MLSRTQLTNYTCIGIAEEEKRLQEELERKLAAEEEERKRIAEEKRRLAEEKRQKEELERLALEAVSCASNPIGTIAK